MKIGIIYKATLPSEKSYIGKTFSDFEKYKQRHIKNALNNNDKYSRAFYNAIRKYGPEKIKWEILFRNKCHINKLNSLEEFFIAYYDSMKNGYNMTPGKDGGATWTKVNISKERRIAHGQKIRQILIQNGFYKSRSGANSHLSRTNGQFKINERIKKTHEKLKRKVRPYSGTNHPNAKRYLLISPNRQLIGAYGNLKHICNKYCLSYKLIFRKINNGIICKNKYWNKNLRFHTNNTIGWEIVEV